MKYRIDYDHVAEGEGRIMFGSKLTWGGAAPRPSDGDMAHDTYREMKESGEYKSLSLHMDMNRNNSWTILGSWKPEVEPVLTPDAAIGAYMSNEGWEYGNKWTPDENTLTVAKSGVYVTWKNVARKKIGDIVYVKDVEDRRFVSFSDHTQSKFDFVMWHLPMFNVVKTFFKEFVPRMVTASANLPSHPKERTMIGRV